MTSDPSVSFRFPSGTCLAGHWEGKGDWLQSVNPSDGAVIAKVRQTSSSEMGPMLEEAQKAFLRWRQIPAPARGEVIRLCGEALREHKQELGRLVSGEMGKILAEGLGEVQEAIDIADYAVGLSRQLCGVTTHSERPSHRLYEQWHPLGVVGIVTAFNFPVAVWAWNAFIAAVCGDVCIWKPSSETPLCAIAVQEILNPILEKAGHPGLFQLAVGPGKDVGQQLVDSPLVPLVSFTGSVSMGRKVAQDVAKRLGRSLLELGGNNALIVSQHARQELALRAVLFGAVGTAGQRCTSTRRLLLHESIFDSFMAKLLKAYASVKIGPPLEAGTLMGPLINAQAVKDFEDALQKAKKQGGRILCGGRALRQAGFFVEPTIVEIDLRSPVVQEETFAPVLYVGRYSSIEDAIAIQNSVPQGLSSSLFSDHVLETETFLSAWGSDCGIANINTGTSGAEIGLAFGGEKETGGGRESGSDSWKAYMRRQTNTINFGTELPLAQGISFGE
ncbi:MAG: aldehyde dehydrogenase family protein [Planctomycetota bacterium]